MSKLRWLGYSLALLVLSIIVLGSFLRNGGVLGWTDVRDPFSHEIPRPYAYRCLPPAVISGVLSLVPASVQDAAADPARSNPVVADLCEQLGWKPEKLPEYLASSVVFILSLWGFAFAFAYLVDRLYVTTWNVRWAMSLAAVAALPCMFVYKSYNYDFPFLALFTLGLALMAARRWVLYSAVLALTALTKETSVLLILVFVLYFRERLARAVFVRILAAQAAVYLVLTAAVRFYFRSNPGQSLEFHFGHNVTLLPFSIAHAVAFGVLIVAVLRGWNEKPVFLRRGLWVLVPLLAVCLFFGLIDEYRDYYEVYPILFVLVSHTALRVLGVRAFSSREARGVEPDSRAAGS